MYKVISRFKELKHDGHIYEVDDIYPKEGAKATKARLEELSTTKNKYQKVFIEEVEKAPDDKG
ncbi:termination factor Rho [Paenibacillus thiaminolyticus]|uniref:termination factor Rho n=1 Tax=Paenibacillus thiaminolyticus TaxID=49283 RepID=UPI002350CC11|nr:termination factor Rho [Paenibacillus thiaminolyticus]WCR29721.1 termination factor Rho [Paenibacillus thiaminolyticus]